MENNPNGKSCVISSVRNENSNPKEYSSDAFFCQEGVKKGLRDTKNGALKTRIRTLLLEHGIRNECDFFQSLGISRQYWYRISWGLDECPDYLKIKIAKALNVDSICIFKPTEYSHIPGGAVSSQPNPQSPSAQLNSEANQ